MLTVVNSHTIRLTHIQLIAYLQWELPKNRAMPKVVLDARAEPDALDVSASSNGASPYFLFSRVGHYHRLSQDKLLKQSDD